MIIVVFNQFIASLILVVFSVLVLWVTRGYPEQPAFWPRLLAILMGVLSLGLLFEEFIIRRREEASRAPSFPVFYGRSIILICLALVYLWFLPRVGYYVTTGAFFIIATKMMGAKPKVIIIGLVAFLVFGYLFFVRLLGLNLPDGFLF